MHLPRAGMLGQKQYVHSQFPVVIIQPPSNGRETFFSTYVSTTQGLLIPNSGQYQPSVFSIDPSPCRVMVANKSRSSRIIAFPPVSSHKARMDVKLCFDVMTAFPLDPVLDQECIPGPGDGTVLDRTSFPMFISVVGS